MAPFNPRVRFSAPPGIRLCAPPPSTNLPDDHRAGPAFLVRPDGTAVSFRDRGLAANRPSPTHFEDIPDDLKDP